MSIENPVVNLEESLWSENEQIINGQIARSLHTEIMRVAGNILKELPKLLLIPGMKNLLYYWNVPWNSHDSQTERDTVE